MVSETLPTTMDRRAARRRIQKVVEANGQVLAYVYGLDNSARCSNCQGADPR